MSSRYVVTILIVVAAAACAHEGARPMAGLGEPSRPAPGSTASPGAVKSLISGTVVTEPYSAIKKGAVVYLEDGPTEPGPGMAAAIDNHDMTFVPFISVIRAGGTITFGNTDPFAHNAFSPDGEGWDIGQIPSHGAVPKTFAKPNVYSVLCNVHKNMLAYVVVTPSSYFAQVDADGRYTMSVPPGTYRVTAWSPRLQSTTKPVTVTGGAVTLNFELGR